MGADPPGRTGDPCAMEPCSDGRGTSTVTPAIEVTAGVTCGDVRKSHVSGNRASTPLQPHLLRPPARPPTTSATTSVSVPGATRDPGHTGHRPRRHQPLQRHRCAPPRSPSGAAGTPPRTACPHSGDRPGPQSQRGAPTSHTGALPPGMPPRCGGRTRRRWRLRTKHDTASEAAWHGTQRWRATCTGRAPSPPNASWTGLRPPSGWTAAMSRHRSTPLRRLRRNRWSDTAVGCSPVMRPARGRRPHVTWNTQARHIQ